jgi:hypothetical protein
MYLIVYGIESSARFFRSTSKRFSISSVMATLYRFCIGFPVIGVYAVLATALRFF